MCSVAWLEETSRNSQHRVSLKSSLSGNISLLRTTYGKRIHEVTDYPLWHEELSSVNGSTTQRNQQEVSIPEDFKLPKDAARGNFANGVRMFAESSQQMFI